MQHLTNCASKVDYQALGIMVNSDNIYETCEMQTNTTKVRFCSLANGLDKRET